MEILISMTAPLFKRLSQLKAGVSVYGSISEDLWQGATIGLDANNQWNWPRSLMVKYYTVMLILSTSVKST